MRGSVEPCDTRAIMRGPSVPQGTRRTKPSRGRTIRMRKDRKRVFFREGLVSVGKHQRDDGTDRRISAKLLRPSKRKSLGLILYSPFPRCRVVVFCFASRLVDNEEFGSRRRGHRNNLHASREGGGGFGPWGLGWMGINGLVPRAVQSHSCVVATGFKRQGKIPGQAQERGFDNRLPQCFPTQRQPSARARSWW